MKNVLITGGARGIGRACSQVFAKNGYNVIINYNNSKEHAEKLQNDLRKLQFNATAVQADICKKDDVDDMISFVLSNFGAVDVLINNAGIAQIKLFTDISIDEYERMMNTNLFGAFYCAQKIVPSMVSQKRGSIINISSVWGIAGASCEVHYSASKAGMIGFTKALAKELAPSQITVNAIAAGLIDTNMNKNLSQDEMALLLDAIPMGRMGKPEEVAKLALFLASDNAKYITAQTIAIDGGWL